MKEGGGGGKVPDAHTVPFNTDRLQRCWFMLPSLASHVGNATTWPHAARKQSFQKLCRKGVLPGVLIACCSAWSGANLLCLKISLQRYDEEPTWCDSNVPSASIIAVNREKQLRTSAMMMLLIS